MELHDKSELIRQLSARMRDLSGVGVGVSEAVPTGWEAVDAALKQAQLEQAAQAAQAGLKLGGVHEFISPDSMRQTSRRCPGGDWPGDRPVCVLSHLARQAAARLTGQLVWVGRECWANPQLLRQLGLMHRCLMVNAKTPADRLWAIDLAIRSPAVACVIGDAAEFKLPATRRLELAAGGRSCLVLLGRPAKERAIASAAWSRWSLSGRISQSLHPVWELELVGCKGMHLTQGGPWPLEWDGAKGSVIVSAAVVDRRAVSPTSTKRVEGLTG